ncbi:PA14 domain-containing protein [Polaribacter atrinae]|uniref:PA14 domain-containing protein n=1 Tax=Polaribacter atrinae TaxID=1333662 RepID=UPI002492BE13|nr:PA14 domain-containing protein [Polaribacter atrinae]
MIKNLKRSTLFGEIARFYLVPPTKKVNALKLILFISFIFLTNLKTLAQTTVVNTSTVQFNSYTVTGGPKQVSFVITGGNGGNGVQAFGGQGATAIATYNLNNGDIIRYLVAEGGIGGIKTVGNTGGGGGSTGIYINNTLALVAGGGGGAGGINGLAANNTINGDNGTGTGAGTGGTNGNGGIAGATGAAGGGFNSAGAGATTTLATGGAGANGSFTLADGGSGTATSPSGNGGKGFSGGGGATFGRTGGAGGGYSGGGGSGAFTSSTNGAAGGGGSYVNNTLTTYVNSSIIAGEDDIEVGALQANGANGSVKIIVTDLADTDNDGIADVNDEDDDNDGILDIDEGCSAIASTTFNLVPSESVVGNINNGGKLVYKDAAGNKVVLEAAGTVGSNNGVRPSQGGADPFDGTTISNINTGEIIFEIGANDIEDQPMLKISAFSADGSPFNIESIGLDGIGNMDNSTAQDAIAINVPGTWSNLIANGNPLSSAQITTSPAGATPISNVSQSELNAFDFSNFVAQGAVSQVIFNHTDNNIQDGYNATFTPTTPVNSFMMIVDDISTSGNGGRNILTQLLTTSITISGNICRDTDGDGIPDSLDSDSDNDGCFDANEAYFGTVANADTDNDGYYGSSTPTVDTANGKISGLTYTTSPNAYYLDPSVNTCNDNDKDGVPDDVDLDDDNDGIPDTEENIGCTGSLNYEFYDAIPLNNSVDNIPTTGAAGVGTVSDFNVDELQSIVTPTDAHTYSIRYTGFINISTTDTYTFYLNSDDGSKIYIDGNEAVDYDGLHDAGGGFVAGTPITLSAGPHAIEVLFFENTGARSLSVHYSSISSPTKTAIPFSILTSNCDTDNDGIPNKFDLDSDNDGIPDIVEAGGTDTDGNGKVDNINPDGTLINDFDNDGLDDLYDTDVTGGTNGTAITNPDSDGDGIPDAQDLDSDNDGIPDVVEAGGTDANGDGRADNFVDTDKDGFNDLVDGDVDGTIDVTKALIITGTDGNSDGIPDNYPNGDTDGDGLLDSKDLDADNDGIPDLVEAGGIDTNGDGRVDTNTDTDNDGLADIYDENATDGPGPDGTNGTALVETDASGNMLDGAGNSIDTDSDGIVDHLDLDADNDGIPDLLEAGGIDTNGDGRVDTNTDTDKDGLADIYDENATDGPGPDGINGTALVETDASGNMVAGAINVIDTDSDGIPNHLDLDSDNDGIVDIIEAGATDTNKDGKVDTIDSSGKLTTDADNDGFADAVDGSVGTPLITTATDTNADGIADTYTKGDADGDNFPNFLDIDADNDGIPDNIEAQPSTGYIAPSGVGTAIADTNNNGVDDVYENLSTGEIAITPENTDSTDLPDYLDDDSDNDGVLDIEENGHTANIASGNDTDNDGLDDAFDDNDDLSITGATVNDGLGVNNKVVDETSLENAFGDADADFNPGTGDLDYRDIPDPADAMITQVYHFGIEKWIEITNIGRTDIPANTIKVQLYKDKAGDQTGIQPDADGVVNTILEVGKSVLINNRAATSINNLGTGNIQTNAPLTDLNDANDIITLSTATGINSWANRYDVASNIANKTSVVRIDEASTTNKNYTADEWVVFIDDAITPYQPIGEANVSGTKRHPQDPLISEILNSDTEANTLLGLHRINITTSTASSNVYTNGFPDRSRSVVIDQDFEHTGNRLSARKLKVETGTTLTVTDQLLVVTNDITLDGDIRLAGTLAQLVQTHTGASTITSTIVGTMGNLLVDQNSEIPSLYRYGYMSSPVNSGTNIYTIEDVLKDGTDPTTPKDITFVPGYDGSFDETNTLAISLADYWIYTYSPESNGRTNWAHQYKDGEINSGDGFIFKGPGKLPGQNYTFVGTPNDGKFETFNTLGAGEDYLIGNPFPSAMNAKKFINDNLNETTGTLYFWEHKESAIGEGQGIDGHIFGGYIGGYATLNLSGGVAANSIVSNNNNGTSGTESTTSYTTPLPYIAIGQGFFIEGSAGGTIEFNNSQRAYVTEGTESVFFKTSEQASKSKTTSNALPFIKLGFEYYNEDNLFLHHQIGISFQATNSFAFNKGYDSEAYETGKTDMYWKFPNDDKNYVIAGVQEISNELEVPLEVIVNYSGQVNIMVDETENVTRDIYITDKLTGTSYDLTSDKITLTLDKGKYTDRFVLNFSESSVLGLDDDLLATFTNIYADNDNNNIVISKSQEIEIQKVELFDILGKKVSIWNIKEQKDTYRLDIKKQIPTGIYIVKMNTNKGETNKKVVIE